MVPDLNQAMNAATKAHMSAQSAASNAAAAAAVAAAVDSKKGAAAALKASVGGKDKKSIEKASGDSAQNSALNMYDPREPRQYVLPDGKHITINTCRFRAPEIQKDVKF